MFSYIIPLLFYSLKTRQLLYNKLLTQVLVFNKFLNVLNFLYNVNLLSKLNLRFV